VGTAISRIRAKTYKSTKLGKRQDKADINDSGELARNEVVKAYSKAGNETA